MRDGLQEGFNILYGSGDSYSLAFSKLTEVVRKAEEDYTVEFIGGLNPKDDGKNKFFAIVMARLVLKDTLKAVSAIAEKAPTKCEGNILDELEKSQLGEER